jgi:hypothetical protein
MTMYYKAKRLYDNVLKRSRLGNRAEFLQSQKWSWGDALQVHQPRHAVVHSRAHNPVNCVTDSGMMC